MPYKDKEKAKESARLRSKKYRDKNKDNAEFKDKNIEQCKKYYADNKNELLQKKKEYHQEHREERLEYSKQYYNDNKTELNEKKRLDRIENPNKYAEQEKNRTRSKIYYVHKKLRNRVYEVLQSSNLKSNHRSLDMLQCDKDTLVNHLNVSGKQFDPHFDIFDYDTSAYHIDHIKTFADVIKGVYTLEDVCHYTNLQILPAKVNLSKGGNSW